MLEAASSTRVSVSSPPPPRQTASLDKHSRTHTGERPFACDVCERRFTEKGALVRHKASRHEEGRPHCCHICSKTFKGPHHPVLVPTFVPPARAAHASACVCVSSQGAAARPPAAPQRPEEVPVFRLRLQVHPTGGGGGSRCSPSLGAALRFGRAALRPRLKRCCCISVLASRLT